MSWKKPRIQEHFCVPYSTLYVWLLLCATGFLDGHACSECFLWETEWALFIVFIPTADRSLLITWWPQNPNCGSKLSVWTFFLLFSYQYSPYHPLSKSPNPRATCIIYCLGIFFSFSYIFSVLNPSFPILLKTVRYKAFPVHKAIPVQVQ